MVKGRLLFLGTGTSHGIPVIGCDCAVCRSKHPGNNRTRTSALLEVGGKRVLLDPCIDFRQQALRFRITSLDAVLVTHAHADHIFGLDELRVFTSRDRQAIPVYSSDETLAELRMTFRYVFDPPQDGGGVPLVELKRVEGEFTAAGLRFRAVPIKHGVLDILGFRLGNLAYLTDCSEIPHESWGMLEGVETLVLGALRYRAHSTHFNLEQAVDVATRLSPKRAFFVHICHDLDHETVCQQLPENMALAYDGLEVPI